MIQDIVPLLESYIIRLVQLNTALVNDILAAFCKIEPANASQKIELLALISAIGIIGVQMGRTLVSTIGFYLALVAIAAWRNKK